MCAAVVQLCSSHCCCLVTACWAEGRIKYCRCVWGNLWRAFEEGVSHSSWSSSRTESWTSHLLRGFTHTMPHSVWRRAQTAREGKNTNSVSPLQSLLTCHSASSLTPVTNHLPLWSLHCYLFHNPFTPLSVFGPSSVVVSCGETGKRKDLSLSQHATNDASYLCFVLFFFHSRQ